MRQGKLFPKSDNGFYRADYGRVNFLISGISFGHDCKTPPEGVLKPGDLFPGEEVVETLGLRHSVQRFVKFHGECDKLIVVEDYDGQKDVFSRDQIRKFSLDSISDLKAGDEVLNIGGSDSLPVKYFDDNGRMRTHVRRDKREMVKIIGFMRIERKNESPSEALVIKNSDGDTDVLYPGQFINFN